MDQDRTMAMNDAALNVELDRIHGLNGFKEKRFSLVVLGFKIAQERVIELEAQLARLREMAKAEFPSHFEQRVLAILDGKESTCE